MAEARLPGLASSVPPARRFAESVLTGWGLTNGGWTAAQIISELAANCALHARTPFRLRILVSDTGICLEVHNDAPSSLHLRVYA